MRTTWLALAVIAAALVTTSARADDKIIGGGHWPGERFEKFAVEDQKEIATALRDYCDDMVAAVVPVGATHRPRSY